MGSRSSRRIHDGKLIAVFASGFDYRQLEGRIIDPLGIIGGRKRSTRCHHSST